MIPPTACLLLMPSFLARATYAYTIRVDFHSGVSKTLDVPSSNLTAEELLADPRQAITLEEQSQYDKRQVCTSYKRSLYELVGDGNPHQNCKIAQVRGTLASCPGSTSTGESHTSSWWIGGGADSDRTPRGMEFSDGGFGVGESETASITQTFSCPEVESDVSEICMQQGLPS